MSNTTVSTVSDYNTQAELTDLKLRLKTTEEEKYTLTVQVDDLQRCFQGNCFVGVQYSYNNNYSKSIKHVW